MFNFLNDSNLGSFEIITPETGIKTGSFFLLKACNGNAIVKAESYQDDSLTTTGNYNTGLAVTIPDGVEVIGKFKRILVSEGTIIAYKFYPFGG